jgi:hypothetical protein
MKLSKQLISGLLLFVIIFQMNLTALYAQDPVEEEEPIVIPPSGRLVLTFEDLGNNTVQISGDAASRFYRINLPGNFQVSPSGSVVDLTTSHFPEEPERPSSVDVLFNGTIVSKLPLTSANSISSTSRIILPANSLQVGNNNMTVELNTGGTCENPGAAVDLVIDKASSVSFDYQQFPYPTDLGLYPFPFTENSLFEIPVTIVLPDQPTENDLSAAATIASGLGRAKAAINLSATLASELDPDAQANNHLIVIGRPDNNSLFAALDLPLEIDPSVIEPGFGVLEETISPWNDFRVVLAVSGLDDEGVGKASVALNRAPHFLGMRGPVAIIVDLGPLQPPGDATSTSFTLENLGYEDQVVYGTLTQAFNYDFSLPLGWELEDTPFFILKFDHAEILQSETSVIDVELNGTPISSALLTPENSENGEMTISLPGHRLRDGQNRLAVTVEMALEGGSECENIVNRRAWTVLSNQSEVFIPFNTAPVQPALEVFPFPFSQNTGLDNTYLAVPDQISSNLANDLVQLSVRLGAASNSERLAIPVVFASAITEELRENNHLILLGRPTQNALLAEINPELPHPFIENTDILEPLKIDNVVFLVDPERNAGLLQIMQSPWNENYSLLAISGTTDDGVALALRALVNGSQRLQGDLAVVEPLLDPLARPGALTIYAIDTREIDSGRSVLQTLVQGNTLSSNQEINLSEQWWK